MAIVNTSLQVKFSVCQTNNCRNIVLTETTGEYNAISNTTGWRSPETTSSPDSAEVSRTVITITDPGGTVYTFDSDILTFSVILFPDPTGEVEMVITEDMLGKSPGEKLDDGQYIITLTFYGDIDSGIPFEERNTFVETASKTLIFTCQTRCCGDTLFHEAAQSDCTDCKKPKIDKALEVDTLLKQVDYAASCGKINMAAKFLAKAQWICNNANCSNC